MEDQLEHEMDTDQENEEESQSVDNNGRLLRGRTKTPQPREEEDEDDASGDENQASSTSSTPRRGLRQRNWEKSTKNDASRPQKSFEEFVAEEDARKERLQSEKKTMDDFLFTGSRRDTDTNGDDGGNCAFYLVIILGIIFGIVIICYPIFGGNEQDTLPINSNNVVSLEDLQNKLLQESTKFRKLYPSQSIETRMHLLAAINSSLSTNEPKQPSSVTILVPPTMKNSKFPLCFTQSYAKLTNSLFSSLYSKKTVPKVFSMDLNYFKKFGEDITGIHNQVKEYFSSGGKSIIVQDVELLNENKHLQIFHWLCDNFLAPDKRATIFFIVPVPQSIFKKYEWKNTYASQISVDVFDSAWASALSDDARPAYVARVAATVLLLNEGDSC